MNPLQATRARREEIFKLVPGALMIYKKVLLGKKTNRMQRRVAREILREFEEFTGWYEKGRTRKFPPKTTGKQHHGKIAAKSRRTSLARNGFGENKQS